MFPTLSNIVTDSIYCRLLQAEYRDEFNLATGSGQFHPLNQPTIYVVPVIVILSFHSFYHHNPMYEKFKGSNYTPFEPPDT